MNEKEKDCKNVAGTASDVPSLDIPLSYFLGENSKRAFSAWDEINEQIYSCMENKEALSAEAQIYALRKILDGLLYECVLALTKRYSVNIEAKAYGGVSTEIFAPADGVRAENKDRVLINFHGGSFAVGAGSGGRVESIPIAALGRVKVVSVDYRMAPEHRFPAATEDAIAVYQALLEDYKPENIGMYGCSAGAMLTAQTIACCQSKGLPLPGAVGMFAAGAHKIEGDSTYIHAALRGMPPFTQASMMYFDGVDPENPMAFPGASEEILSKFPPSLLITSSRDFLMSSVIFTHSEMIRLGVEVSLRMWEGLEHAFHFNPDFSESRDAYGEIVKHFDRHLG